MKQRGSGPFLAGCETRSYRVVDGVSLLVHIRRRNAGRTPGSGVVWYHGGGWRSGTPEQFAPHADYFAGRGVTSILVQYRLGATHGVTPYECVDDARAALIWTRDHAAELGIDPAGIVVGGGSAGGHLAAVVGMTWAGNPPIRAMLLCNPVLDTDIESWGDKAHNVNVAGLLAQFGDRGRTVSPMHLVAAHQPPALIVHGEDDVTVPFGQAQRYATLMQQAGNFCRLVGYPGKGHAFFNYNRERAMFRDTVLQMERFLAERGALTGPPELDAWLARH